jgi:folate-binding protein YgfZ
MFWCEVQRDSVLVTGADAATFLQSQLSQDLRPLRAGESTWSFVLTPTGKVEALVRVLRRDETTFVLDTDAGFGDALVARLSRFRIRVAVEFTSVQRRIVAVRSPDGLPVSHTAGADGALVSWGSGVDLDVTDSVAALDGIEPGTAAQLHAARVEACWPSMGAEIEPGDTVPAETGVVAVAVSFSKGCYPGQELVERMDSRGARSPFRLETVDVAPGAAPGDDWSVGGEVAGRLTSVADRRAIARVRRSTASS